jgi:hypothetical protein
MNNPFKMKNRVSALGLGGEKEKKDDAKQSGLDPKRDASPAANLRERLSQVSLAESNGGGGGGGGAPLMLTQSHAREELLNLKQQQLALRPPILGIQPTFVSSAVPPVNPLSSVTSPLVAALSPRMSESTQENLLVGQRALMYVWLVKKWLKRPSGEGSDMGLFGALNLRPSQPGAVHGGVEVRFEWKRAKAKGGRKARRQRTSTDDEAGVREEKKKHRMSTGSFSTTTASEEGAGAGGVRFGVIDDGDDSDPEDSETPWVCTLKIRRMGTGVVSDVMSPPATAFSDAGFPRITPQILRVKVGTLSPTPHHPKVVAMLKVPFPLPDVEVERLGVVWRKDFEEHEPYNGLTLMAEEIKDIVCSTGLWLVVREGFGGVGRVSRKGDGWRIRA